jgi:sugar (pentulose or hexulose) kinase
LCLTQARVYVAPERGDLHIGTQREHLRGSSRRRCTDARAALESIAFQSAELLHAMQGEAATPLTELRVDGGAARNELLLQFQADLIGVPVIRPVVTETTALGAAYLQGEYGIKDMVIGVPVRLGKNGIEKIIELELTSERKSHP